MASRPYLVDISTVGRYAQAPLLVHHLENTISPISAQVPGLLRKDSDSASAKQEPGLQYASARFGIGTVKRRVPPTSLQRFFLRLLLDELLRPGSHFGSFVA